MSSLKTSFVASNYAFALALALALAFAGRGQYRVNGEHAADYLECGKDADRGALTMPLKDLYFSSTAVSRWRCDDASVYGIDALESDPSNTHKNLYLASSWMRMS